MLEQMDFWSLPFEVQVAVPDARITEVENGAKAIGDHAEWEHSNLWDWECADEQRLRFRFMRNKTAALFVKYCRFCNLEKPILNFDVSEVRSR